jgi:hypothetical protein
MIDYEKLKMAHELLHKVRVKECSIAFHVGHYNNIVLTYIDDDELHHEYEFSNLDDLTTKLYGLFPKRPKEEWELRYKKLEEHKQRQLDEDRAASRRMDQLEELIGILQSQVNALRWKIGERP